jgi:hypothetical protein
MKILVWLVGLVLAGAVLFTEPYAASQNVMGKISEDRIPVVQAGLTGSPGVFTGLSASQARVISKTRPKSTRVGGNPCPTIVIRSATSEAIFLRRVQQCGFGREAH